jgi:hypothetical protein
MPNLTAQLAPEEFASLLEVNKGLMQCIIPLEHRKRFIQLGYVVELLGGLALTNHGRARLAMGR